MVATPLPQLKLQVIVVPVLTENVITTFTILERNNE